MHDTSLTAFLVGLAFLLGIGFGNGYANSSMREEAIKHGVAHYSADKAEFTWRKP